MTKQLGILIFITSALLSCAIPSPTPNATEPPPSIKKPLPILQTVTTTSSARFVVVVPDGETLNYYALAPDGQKLEIKAARVPTPGSAVIDQLEVSRLAPRIDYELFVADRHGEVWDKRKFRTLETSRRRARLALVSEAGSGHSPEQDQMWRSLAALKPDLILFLGGSWGGLSQKGSSAKEIWKQALQARFAQALYQFNPLIPVLATWNDQEFGKREGDQTFAEKDHALEVFQTLYSSKDPAEGFLPGPGAASRLNAFGATFLLLDNRSFRVGDDHFGLKQNEWVQNALGDDHQPAFLASGEAFKNPGEWGKLGHPLVFLSGNGHYSRILRVGASYELTSSPMRKIKNKDEAAAKDPNEIARSAGEMSFVVLELIREELGFLQFGAEIIGPGQKQEYQRTFTVKSL